MNVILRRLLLIAKSLCFWHRNNFLLVVFQAWTSKIGFLGVSSMNCSTVMAQSTLSPTFRIACSLRAFPMSIGNYEDLYPQFRVVDTYDETRSIGRKRISLRNWETRVLCSEGSSVSFQGSVQ
jgi:hypothetical protein